MTRETKTLLMIAFYGCTAGLLCGTDSAVARQEPQLPADQLAYHDHPPREPLPPTLDPESFRQNRAAYVTYKLAAGLVHTLYQVPCYCPCRRGLGHESLLDCYASKHGERCPTCQREVLFCYREHKKGKSPAEIRAAMAKGKAAKLDLAKTVDRYYAEIERAQK